MIHLKSPEEIEIMKEGGRITALILKEVLALVGPGIKSLELENLALSLIDKFRVKASFKTVREYPFALCLSLNKEIVHGLPGERKLQRGDLLSVDFGVLHQGFHSDMARTVVVGGQKTKEISRFLDTGQRALKEATDQVRPGRRVGHISQTIGKIVEEGGYCPVENLVGHGIGKTLHEDPQIPCFLVKELKKTPILEVGMVVAIEVMYAQGGGEIKVNGWPVVTADGSLSAHFENTIAVTREGPVVLTQ